MGPPIGVQYFLLLVGEDKALSVSRISGAAPAVPTVPNTIKLKGSVRDEEAVLIVVPYLILEIFFP